MTAPTPTAAIIVIGNEILSGRTQDANVAFMARELAARGILLREVRMVRDEEVAIIDTVRHFSDTHTVVFTTGGIGATHDDITAASVAGAFGVPLILDEAAKNILVDYYAARGIALNDIRLRMARVPKGAVLIPNPVSGAPGFRMKNVYVMAGVPKIMQAMFMAVVDELPAGAPLIMRSLSCSLREGDIADALEAVQKNFTDVEIGSYPAMPGLTLVARGINANRVEKAARAIEKLIRDFGDVPEA